MQKPKRFIVSVFHRFFISLLAVSLCLEPSAVYGLRSQAPQEGTSAGDLARMLDAGAFVRGGLEEVHYRDFFRANNSGLRKISDYSYQLEGQVGAIFVKRKTPGITITLGDSSSDGLFSGEFIEIDEGVRKIRGENTRRITVLQGVYPATSGSRRQSRIVFKHADPDVSLPLIRSIAYDPSAAVPAVTLTLDPRAGDFPERRFQISSGGPRTGKTLLLRIVAGKVPLSEEFSEATTAAAGVWRYQPMELSSLQQIESRLADLDPRWNVAGQAIRERALVRIADLQKKLPLFLERIAAEEGLSSDREIRSVYLRGDYAYSDRQDSPVLLVVIDGGMPWSGTKPLHDEVTLEVGPGMQRSGTLSYELTGMDDAQRARADEKHPQHNRVSTLYRAVPLAGEDFYRLPFPGESGREEDLEQEVRAAIAEKRRLPVVVLHAYDSGAGAEVAYEPEGRTGPNLLGFLPMADLFDDPGKKLSLLVKRAWLQSQVGKVLNLLPVEIGQGKNGTRVVYSLKRDFTADLYQEQMFFRRVMLLNDWRGEIESFLDWLMGQGIDPRMLLVEMYFQDGRWARMSEGQRCETVRWLANHLYEPRFEKALFPLFEDASRTEPWSESRIWAARGMVLMARKLQKETQVLEELQRLWAETAGWGERFQADGRLSILKSARLLNTPEVLRWVETLPPLVSGAEESGLEEPTDLLALTAKPDEVELIDKINNWQQKIKIGSTVNVQALEIAIGGFPADVTRFHHLLELVRRFPADVYAVEDSAIEYRGAWRGEMALWLAEEATRQAGFEPLITVLETGNVAAIPGIKPPVSATATLPATAEVAPPLATAEVPPPLATAEVPPPPAEMTLPPAVSEEAVAPPRVPETVIEPETPITEPAKTAPASVAPAVVPTPQFYFSADDPNLLDEIFDPKGMWTRGNPEWTRLYERLISQTLKDEKPGSPDNWDRQARLIAYRAYREATAMDFTTEELYRISRGQTFFDRLTGKIVRGHVSDPRLKVFTFALIVIRVMEGMREDKELGVPPEPRSLEAGLSLREYLQRSRELLVYTSRHRDYRELPRLVAGFVGSVGRRALNEPVSFGISSVLALRQFGQEPSIRCVPELSEAFLKNGITHVEFIPATPGNPPALFVHLRKPFVDTHGDIQLPAVAVALLKEGQRWPELPVVEISKPWLDLSDQELLDAAERSMSKELESVELLDEARVKELSFAEEDSPQVKVQKVGQLVRLALEEQLVSRSSYVIFQRKGIERLARYMGRMRANQEAMRQHMELEFGAITQDPNYQRPPVTTEAVAKLRGQLAEWESKAGLLFRLGVPQLTNNPEGLNRAGEIIDRLGTKKIPFQLEQWDPYLPLITLMVSRAEDGGWVISDLDAKTFLNRFGQFRSVVQDTAVKGLIQQLADSFPDPLDRVSFLVALNSALLSAIPAKPEKPFRDVTLNEVQKALVKSSAGLSGAQIGHSPVASLLLAKEREVLLEKIRLIQQRMWELFQRGLEESLVEEMEKALKEMEPVVERLQAIGVPPASNPPSVNLKSAAEFKTGITNLQGWVKASLTEAAVPAATDPARLELFRGLVDVRRLAEEGRFREAFDRTAALRPQLAAGEAARVKQFQDVLYRRMVEEALAPVRQLAESGAFDQVILFIEQLKRVYELAAVGQDVEALQLGTTLLPQLDAEMAARFRDFLGQLAGRVADDLLSELSDLAELGELTQALTASAPFIPQLQGEHAGRLQQFRQGVAQRIADNALQQCSEVAKGSEDSAVQTLEVAVQLLDGFPPLQERLRKRGRAIQVQKRSQEGEEKRKTLEAGSLGEAAVKLQADFQRELDESEYGSAGKFLKALAGKGSFGPDKIERLIHHLEGKQMKHGGGVLSELDRRILELAKRAYKENKAGLEEPDVPVTQEGETVGRYVRRVVEHFLNRVLDGQEQIDAVYLRLEGKVSVGHTFKVGLVPPVRSSIDESLQELGIFNEPAEVWIEPVGTGIDFDEATDRLGMLQNSFHVQFIAFASEE